MATRLDHIVIGAASLEDGVEFVREQFGVDIPKGGEHPLMATHNHLMQVGNSAFVEIIAINTMADHPKRLRWFGLDDPAVRASLAKQPRLLTWVVNTDDLVELEMQVNIDIGVITPLSRGTLNWLFAVPDDGRLLANGMLPYVMQWKTDVHPSTNMADLGCQLKALHIYHPYPEWLSSVLSGLEATELVNVHGLEPNTAAFMTAEMSTPKGDVVLSSLVPSD